MPTRRQILIAVTAVAITAGTTRTAVALETIEYSPETLRRLQDSGKPFLIDFFATWCVTCAAQERVLAELTAGSAAYRGIPILRVDWDRYGDGELARSLAIPRRSTLVLMRGTTELGRLVAETRMDRIAGLLALAAG
jgi:thiol-disulfide isomerase/thioredoxin